MPHVVIGRIDRICALSFHCVISTADHDFDFVPFGHDSDQNRGTTSTSCPLETIRIEIVAASFWAVLFHLSAATGASTFVVGERVSKQARERLRSDLSPHSAGKFEKLLYTP